MKQNGKSQKVQNYEMHVRNGENAGGNILDKYNVKMFPQAYRDIDKIYGQALLVSNYADDAIALAEKLEKAIRLW